MSYTLKLTDAEVETLGWMANRGYFPKETFDKMHLAEGQDEESDGERVWEIPEAAAWAISELREEDPHALFACCGGFLLDKLLELEGKIV